MAMWGSISKAGWKLVVVAFVNGLTVVTCSSPLPPCKGHQHPPHKVTWGSCATVHYLCLELYRLWTDLGHQTNGFFINGFILHVTTVLTIQASYQQSHSWMGHPYYHTSFVNMEGLVWRVLQVTQVHVHVLCPPPLTSGYFGQGQSCPPSNHSLMCYVLLNAHIHVHLRVHVYAVCVCVSACACVWPIWQVQNCISDTCRFQCLLGCTAYWWVPYM